MGYGVDPPPPTSTSISSGRACQLERPDAASWRVVTMRSARFLPLQVRVVIAVRSCGGALPEQTGLSSALEHAVAYRLRHQRYAGSGQHGHAAGAGGTGSQVRLRVEPAHVSRQSRPYPLCMSRPVVPGYLAQPNGSSLADLWTRPAGVPVPLWPAEIMRTVHNNPAGWMTVAEHYVTETERSGTRCVLVQASDSTLALAGTGWIGSHLGQVEIFDDETFEDGLAGTDRGLSVEFFAHVRRPSGAARQLQRSRRRPAARTGQGRKSVRDPPGVPDLETVARGRTGGIRVTRRPAERRPRRAGIGTAGPHRGSRRRDRPCALADVPGVIREGREVAESPRPLFGRARRPPTADLGVPHAPELQVQRRRRSFGRIRARQGNC